MTTAMSSAGTGSVSSSAAKRAAIILATARREFTEETGFPVEGPFIPLTPLRQQSGKVIHAWAFEGDADPARLRSNTFSLEWPPKSGRQQEFPEADRAAWFPLGRAAQKSVPGQRGFFAELARLLS